MSKAEELKLLDGFAASRKRWFGSEKDYKTWKSVRKVLWHDEIIMRGNAEDNSFICYLEALAKFAIQEQEKAVSLARKEGREKWENKDLVSKDFMATVTSRHIPHEVIEMVEARVREETAKEIFEEIDSNFYYQFPVGKKPRVDMPRDWYDEIKNSFLSKPQSDNGGKT